RRGGGADVEVRVAVGLVRESVEGDGLRSLRDGVVLAVAARVVVRVARVAGARRVVARVRGRGVGRAVGRAVAPRVGDRQALVETRGACDRGGAAVRVAVVGRVVGGDAG